MNLEINGDGITSRDRIE